MCPGRGEKISPGVPPLFCKACNRGGGSGQAGGPGGSPLGRGCAKQILLRVLPLYCVCPGGPAKTIPRVPPSDERCEREGGPRRSSGLVGRLLGWGRVPKYLRGFSPLDCVCLGGPAKNIPGIPPSDARGARVGDPGQAGGPCERSLGQVGSRSGSLVPGCKESPSGEGGAAKFLRGFFPLGYRRPQVPAEYFPGVPP